MKNIKKILFVIIAFFAFTNFVNANNYIEKKLDWHLIKVIKYDLKNSNFVFKIGVNLDYNASSLRDLMIKFNWVSAINWVFLCPEDYKECGWKNFTKNERYYKWYKIWDWISTWERVVFAISKNKKAFLYQTDKINPESEKNIYYGFSNFPLLLQDWISKIEDYKLDYKMKVKSKRNFICSDKNSNFILNWYVYNISLKELPDFLKKLGCDNALNLDAWATSSMIYNGRNIIWPGRKLLDWVIIERKWLKTKNIVEKIEKIASIFDKQMKKNTKKERYNKTQKILKNIRKFRTDFYNKNSKDLFNEKNEKVGYEITINSLKKQKLIFLVNSLEYEIKKLNWRYKKETEEQKRWEELLF